MRVERYGIRPSAYSSWHRVASIRRYIGIEWAQLLTLSDLDCCMYCEYDRNTHEPLAIFETAVDVGQASKGATVVQKLAKRSGLAAYIVLFRHAAARNPADPAAPDIDRFRIKRLWPHPEQAWRTLTPAQWAVALIKIRAWSARRLDVQAANDDVYDPIPYQGELLTGEWKHGS